MMAMSKEAPPSRSAPQFVVRLPDEEFRKKIAAAAEANNRSMNAEIVARLSASFDASAGRGDGKANQLLLRTMATFVLMRREHPHAMQGPMEEAILEMAEAIKDADSEAIFQKAEPALHKYIRELVGSVERVTELLGPGWANASKKESINSPAKKLLVGNLGTDRPSHPGDVLRPAAVIPPKLVSRRTKK